MDRRNELRRLLAECVRVCGEENRRWEMANRLGMAPDGAGLYGTLGQIASDARRVLGWMASWDEQEASADLAARTL